MSASQVVKVRVDGLRHIEGYSRKRVQWLLEKVVNEGV